MEITLKREALSSTLQNINSVVDKSSTKPILSNFVIRTLEDDSSNVEFSSTDYELSLVEVMPAQIKDPGSICVNAKKVFDIVKELKMTKFIFVRQNNSGSILPVDHQNYAFLRLK